MDTGIVVLYAFTALVILAAGDGLGCYLGRQLMKRTHRHYLPRLPFWAGFPLAIITPCFVLGGILLIALRLSSRGGNSVELMVDSMELLILGAFFTTGLISGFFCKLRG